VNVTRSIARLDLCPTHTEGEDCDQTGLNSPARAADIIHWLCSDQPETRHHLGYSEWCDTSYANMEI